MKIKTKINLFFDLDNPSYEHETENKKENKNTIPEADGVVKVKEGKDTDYELGIDEAKLDEYLSKIPDTNKLKGGKNKIEEALKATINEFNKNIDNIFDEGATDFSGDIETSGEKEKQYLQQLAQKYDSLINDYIQEYDKIITGEIAPVFSQINAKSFLKGLETKKSEVGETTTTTGKSYFERGLDAIKGKDYSNYNKILDKAEGKE